MSFTARSRSRKKTTERSDDQADPGSQYRLDQDRQRKKTAAALGSAP